MYLTERIVDIKNAYSGQKQLNNTEPYSFKDFYNVYLAPEMLKGFEVKQFGDAVAKLANAKNTDLELKIALSLLLTHIWFREGKKKREQNRNQPREERKPKPHFNKGPETAGEHKEVKFERKPVKITMKKPMEEPAPVEVKPVENWGDEDN